MKTQEDREHYRKHPIYKTDFSKPTSVLIEDIRSDIKNIRGRIFDIKEGIGWEVQLESVECLLTYVLTALYSHKKEMVKLEMAHDDIKNGPSLTFSPRGIGLDTCLSCFICGASKRHDEAGDYLGNLSAFVRNKQEGEEIVSWFTQGARLDFRPSAPDWIQIKVGACDIHLPELNKLFELTSAYGLIRRKMIEDITS